MAPLLTTQPGAFQWILPSMFPSRTLTILTGADLLRLITVTADQVVSVVYAGVECVNDRSPTWIDWSDGVP